MRGIMDMPCREYHIDHFVNQADIVFTALPHKLPMSVVPELMAHQIRVVDLSADFRFRNVAVYEKHYQHHTAGKLSESAVYGLPEIHAEKIRNAPLIGNPGCYPTSLLLPLIPLMESKMVKTGSIIADAKSGVSGAGRSISLGTHFCEVNESFKAYKVADHRHIPEMEENLSIAAKESVQITFVPHLVPMTRGMLTTIYAELSRPVHETDVRELLKSYYHNRCFIRICREGEFPDVSNVKTTNFCDIGLKIDKRNNRIVLVSVIDNLVKGAAGQAVQNMNLMMGLDERTGLDAVPLPV
jgi:N-acetyl-gamma-glutamyl-phosphate reductase